MEHFGQICKYDDRVNIAKVVTMIYLFPSFSKDLKNERMIEELPKEEFYKEVNSFQSIRVLDHGIHLGYFGFIEDYLIKCNSLLDPIMFILINV